MCTDEGIEGGIESALAVAERYEEVVGSGASGIFDVGFSEGDVREAMVEVLDGVRITWVKTNKKTSNTKRLDT